MTPEKRPVYQPGPSHPITVEPTGKRVTVRVRGEVVAETVDALTLAESSYPAVQYIPFADAVAERFRRTNATSYCPYKGDAGYYSVVMSVGDVVGDAVWTYERPYAAVAAIAGHIAFYPDKADITIEGHCE